MTTERELNEALAKLIGFQDLADKESGVSPFQSYQLLDGSREYLIPDFTHDFSACSKYLVPWVRAELGVTKVSFSYLGESIRCLLLGGFQARDELSHAYIEKGSEALALCRAVENLHNSLSSLQSNRVSVQQDRERYYG